LRLPAGAPTTVRLVGAVKVMHLALCPAGRGDRISHESNIYVAPVAFVGTPRAVELLRFMDPPGHPECMTAALALCPHLAIERHRRARADRPGGGIMPPGSHGDRPAGWTLGITRTYRTLFIPGHGFTVYLPAPFRTVRAYVYGPDGRLQPPPGTR
jgi:hypothetical protein